MLCGSMAICNQDPNGYTACNSWCSRKKKTGVERSIADQQLVRIKVIDGSKAFPRSIGVSLLPIVTSCPDGRQVGLLLKVSLVSSFVINENDLSKLKQEEK